MDNSNQQFYSAAMNQQSYPAENAASLNSPKATSVFDQSIFAMSKARDVALKAEHIALKLCGGANTLDLPKTGDAPTLQPPLTKQMEKATSDLSNDLSRAESALASICNALGF